MEHLNRIELIGRVGRAEVMDVASSKVVRFSLGVDSVYRGGAGVVVDTAWFNCVWWPKAGEDPYTIEKGRDAHIEGRMHAIRFCGEDGREKTSYEVKVQKVWS